ncbi:MAG: hypothetical protein EPO68_05960 [Planctomycetota bacterium]|nr:MAG: hypothetical protein EPO68_05960 [Planctomycetota bacterium]
MSIAFVTATLIAIQQPALDAPGPLFIAPLASPVRIEADGAPIDVGADIAHAGPLLADITGDGTPELLVGTFRGVIHVYSNSGTRAQPKWESEGLLQAEGEDVRIHNW